MLESAQTGTSRIDLLNTCLLQTSGSLFNTLASWLGLIGGAMAERVLANTSH